jgi:hypothetical protein
MAPRTRSNRAEKLAVQKLLSSGISVNNCGLPALPNEIYLEILSHMPALPIPHDVWVDKKTDPLRQLTLYYLTQSISEEVLPEVRLGKNRGIRRDVDASKKTCYHGGEE